MPLRSCCLTHCTRLRFNLLVSQHFMFYVHVLYISEVEPLNKPQKRMIYKNNTSMKKFRNAQKHMFFVNLIHNLV